ncbi:MAG: hypothetical protein DIU61_003890 [Bacteroidota bacterium]|jgi:hypothetical protein|nr:MAG: hypothetical protein DIU61_02060 [Bacteroidota bacterium]
MKKKFAISLWPPGNESPSEHQVIPGYQSTHRAYFNEGDEFLDDAIRTTDQTFAQVEGTVDVLRIRSQQSRNTESIQ